MNTPLTARWFAFFLVCAALQGAHAQNKPNTTKLEIAYHADIGRVVLSWTGKGVLKEAPDANGKFKPVKVPNKQSYYVLEPNQKKAVYRLDSAAHVDSWIYSVNIVGYVNVSLPPGLSLISNPLFAQVGQETVGDLWHWVPAGSQILKYVPGIGFEVSTYDGDAQGWSNPNLETPVGQGFYFRNPTSQTVMQTFVGEVHQGYLTNTLPAGFSMKASLVPQSGSINSVHQIPGEHGDQIRLWTNDLQGGGVETISTFSGELNQWVPDINLGIAQGFWIHKQHQQDWVRFFVAN